MGYKLGFAGGFADVEEEEELPPQGGGGRVLTIPYRPAPSKRQVRVGLSTIRLTVKATVGAGAAVGRTAQRFEVASRSYDPALEEREDRILIALALAEMCPDLSFSIPLPIGQEAEARDRWNEEQWAKGLRERLGRE